MVGLAAVKYLPENVENEYNLWTYQNDTESEWQWQYRSSLKKPNIHIYEVLVFRFVTRNFSQWWLPFSWSIKTITQEPARRCTRFACACQARALAGMQACKQGIGRYGAACNFVFLRTTARPRITWSDLKRGSIRDFDNFSQLPNKNQSEQKGRAHWRSY